MSNLNNKKIARNTILLYIRMLLIMVVTLLTVRIMLKTMGVIDYGIYNVVGGLVVTFSFLSNTMASASQRYFAFEIGKNDKEKLKRTFSISLIIFFMIAFVLLIIAETAGLWFLNNKLVIPLQKMDSANWLYQFAIISFLVNIITIPYISVIIAHENMKVFAYVSILEVVIKLLAIYFLTIFPYDKLKTFAFLTCLTSCIIAFVYRSICLKNYSECKYEYHWDRELFSSMLSFSGWNLFGSLALVLNGQGINMLLNIFWGPIINATMGISNQVNTAINQFVNNYLTAVKPQIIKYYASNDKQNMFKLVFQSSKLAYFLLFIISMPILLETHIVLSIWLSEIPNNTILFTRLTIIIALVDSISYPLMTLAQATGRIKMYQIVVGGVMLLNLPLSYISFKLGFPPECTLFIAINISLLCFVLRIIMLKRMVAFPVAEYLKKTLLVIILVTIIAYIFPIFIVFKINESFNRLLISCLISSISSLITIYFIGLSENERITILQQFRKYILKIDFKRIFSRAY